MALKPLPTARTAKIAVGTCIRKPIDVVKLYLKHLDAQWMPPGVKLVPYFALDTEDDEVCRTVEAWASARGGTTFRSKAEAADYGDQGPTHHWTHSAFARVGNLKNQLIRLALDDGCEGFWFVDADLLCDTFTFDSLWSLDAQIACGVYWTQWDARGGEPLPQVWLNHPYELEGRGRSWPEFRAKLTGREITQVWGQGACTLIRDHVFHKGVDFSPVEGLPQGGMWQGEDRAFCIRAEQAHLVMLADGWPDIFHIYHPTDRGETAERWSETLLAVTDGTPKVGDLVSVALEPLEPIAVGGHPQRMPAYTWRGRAGHGRLLPELDDLVLSLERGQAATVAVPFPTDYPLDVLRGHRRLMRVVLMDHKPFRRHPNLGSAPNGSDLARYTDRQLAGMRG